CHRGLPHRHSVKSLSFSNLYGSIRFSQTEWAIPFDKRIISNGIQELVGLAGRVANGGSWFRAGTTSRSQRLLVSPAPGRRFYFFSIQTRHLVCNDRGNCHYFRKPPNH